MRTSRTVTAGLVAATAVAAAVAGCGGHKTSSPTQPGSTSASATPGSTPASSAKPTDYADLLIQATDIDAPVTFTGNPPTPSPNGQPGVAVTFSTDDASHMIKDTIQVLADPAAATNALNAAKSAQGGVLKNLSTGTSKVGTGGTTLSGNSPDGSKGVTLLLFTEGRAFVTLEFDGPADALAPSDYVDDVGHKQDAAVKKGLGG